MSFQDIADLDCTKTTALGGRDKKSGKNNPTSIEGYYVGTRQVPSQKSKTGVAALHVFQTKEGNVGVWGKTNLDQKMAAVKPGQMTRVAFTGMVETKNNPMYKYRVQVDPENTIEVSTAESGDDAGYSEDTSSDSLSDNGYVDESVEETTLESDDTAQDEITPARATRPSRPATSPSANSTAKVQQLLNGRTAKRA